MLEEKIDEYEQKLAEKINESLKKEQDKLVFDLASARHSILSLDHPFGAETAGEPPSVADGDKPPLP